jgi:predicted dehydrogenase
MDEERSKRSIAIAGAWGYIGRKFIDAGVELGYDVYVNDPGPVPDDLDLSQIMQVESVAEFYDLDVDLFHLALHPEHRKGALDVLFPRARKSSFLILNEKPMTSPEAPAECAPLVRRVRESGANLLFDFPELFDPITDRIFEYLNTFDNYTISEVRIQRSKDREDRSNPRNSKRMVPIQFQESVHCLAFLLNFLARKAGSVDQALQTGFSLRASSDPYDPPNPEDYTYVVDGRCDFDMRLGETSVIGHTDFKRGAPFRKERIIRGIGDGEPFEILVDYLENAKYLVINAEDQRFPPWGNSYTAVLEGIERMRREVSPEDLMTGVYPNAGFAQYTFQLSSALWRASRDGVELMFSDAGSLLAFDAGFADEMDQFERY